MRRIDPNCLKVNISQAGLPDQGLLEISISIPIDKYLYLSGDNLIDSIIPQSVPDIPDKLDYLSEEVSLEQLGLLAGLITTGIATDLSNNPEAIKIAAEYLGYADNALLGTISLAQGDRLIKYTQ